MFLGSNNTLRKSLQAAYDLEQLAIKKGINIVEPFEGTTAFNNIIHILGPSLDYYYELTGDFEPKTTVASVVGSIIDKIKEVISEHWDDEKLEDPHPDAVNARNNSSVITLLSLEKNFLFLGDSGVPAIEKAVSYADSQGFDIASNVHYLHVPHHGSKRNVGPTILDRIVGKKVNKGEMINKIAFISACPNNSKHPSKRVKNALIRRGVKVAETCGSDHCYRSSDVPVRAGWGPITFVEFAEVYDEE
jgi:hypothetical protein